MSEEGTIELQIDRVAEFVRSVFPESQRVLSAPTYIYGLPWKILAYPELTTGSAVNQRTLGFYLQCNEEDDDPNWNCKASAKMHIVSQKAGVYDYVDQLEKNFSSKEKGWGYPTFIRCDVLLNPQKGFIKDGVVILRAHVKAEMPQGAQMSKLRAFSSSISDSSDGVLIIGTKKIPIHKMYLSYNSEYFKTMFRSEFKESRENEIVLKEVGYVDMLHLLSVIYPFNAQITEKDTKLEQDISNDQPTEQKKDPLQSSPELPIQENKNSESVESPVEVPRGSSIPTSSSAPILSFMMNQTTSNGLNPVFLNQLAHMDAAAVSNA